MNFLIHEGFYFIFGLLGVLVLVFFPKLLASIFLNQPKDLYKEEEEE